MSKKKMVSRKEFVEAYELEGKLSDLRNTVDGWIKKFGENASFNEGWDGEWEIHWSELETDREYTLRVEQEARNRNKAKADAVKKEERERKELARLLKKYG